MQRREFVSNAARLGGLSMLSGVSGGVAGTAFAAPDMPMTTLGRTGVRVSRLGVGCAPLGRDEVSNAEVSNVLHRAVEMGINYIDTAPNYNRAEEKMGPAVKEIRDRIFLVSKTEEPTYEGTWRLLKQSLKRLQTDHLDMVHIHNFGHEERFPDLSLTLGPKGTLGALQEARKEGVIRFIGASGHLHPSRFHRVLETGEIDVLMNAVNFIVRHTYDFEHKVWTRARMEGLGLVAMKVLGGRDNQTNQGRIPAQYYEQAIRYSQSVPGVCTSVIGVKSVSELESAAAVVSQQQPFSTEEARAVTKAGLDLAGTDDWKEAYGVPLL